MLIQIAVGIIALAVVVLVAFVVPVLIQLRKTVEEAEHLVRNLNRDLPLMFKEAGETVHALNRVAENLREGSEKAKVLGEAIGGIGETVNQVHGAVRGGAASLWSNAGGLLAGVRAAVRVLSHGSPDGRRGGDY
jgi:uncharacterized protein YoxC